MKATLKILLVLMMGCLPAWAALGEYEGSVSLDQQILGGEIREEVHTGYKLHQIITARGAVIREYVSPAGKVFAISWHAPFIPDLTQLLGSYFPRVQQAAQAKVLRSGPLVIETRDFVYFSGGRMMNFHGSAHVPGLLPENVTAGVVR
ncbi:MAG TPA: DUF2844 domain-containing protein [Terriglobia bacterium]|nr:DUF2844 domain-containing protein [Terriglobia bacterium]